MPWARLRRVIEEVCRRPRSVGEIDVDALVDRIGRGVPVHRVPRRLRRLRAPRVVVVFDRAERLIPFWRDQLEVFEHLRGELGAHGVGHRWWRRGPPWRGADDELVAVVDPTLEEGDVVLVLGDLGHYQSMGSGTLELTPGEPDPPEIPGDGGLSGAWARLGEALRRHGVIAAALLPVPSVRWRPEVLGPWVAVDWCEPDRAALGVPLGSAEREARRDRLLALVSWTQRLEPALLREVRLCLPATEADAGTEADVWNYEESGEHEDVQQHPAGLLVSDELRRRMHAQLRSVIEQRPQLVRRVVDVVRRHHAGLARELWLDEVRGLLSIDETMVQDSFGGPGGVTSSERQEAIAWTHKVRAYLNAGQRGGLGPSVDLQHWLRLFLDGQAREVWTHADWGQALTDTWDLLGAGTPDRDVPPGLDLRRLRPPPESVKEQRFVVAQRGDELHVGAEGVVDQRRGSLVVTVMARARRLQVGSRMHVLSDDDIRVIPLPEGQSIVLSTDRAQRVSLQCEPKPAWAHAIGRDRYGLWATLRVRGVEQRMRWIAPGRFMMGSPESEPGRWEDEGPQHEVTLTQGFWLADTPCTQDLWQAVMDENPSRFRSPRRPVEQVSWDDVQRFLVRLNQGGEDERAARWCLPTEAQWEYACRAGTTAATHAGPIEILGDNNAPVLHDIAWYGGNSGVDYDLDEFEDSAEWPEMQYPHTRAGTRDVGLKQPNQWGLYDMLGNVEGWCADVPRDYEAAAVQNPGQYDGPSRVRRGGSWFSDARLVRVACRRRLPPGHRRGHLGFRLARGQDLRQASEPE
ncbi:MAG: formylglycine-generating enzyme family protein [Myxococcota bacterium]